MGHYKSNLRDVTFNLFELLGPGSGYGASPFEEYDRPTVSSMLTEVERLARENLSSSFVEGDRTPPTFDPSTHSVTMPPGFAADYQRWMDSDWWQLQVPAELGGQAAPATLIWATAEFVLGANPALWVYASTPTVARVIAGNGTERDQSIARILLERRWTGTMVLTEAEAGSDVGAAQTNAVLNPDGTWDLEGTKRFITAGDHDMSENILHLVLARPVGVEGLGGPGTKGLSLFLVPKYDFDPVTGELTGRRNGVRVTGLEHKMGLHASATCELSLGGDEPARGWLLGEVHQGMAQMFDVIEYARMMVGAKAVATLSTGYLNALEYARTRVQGPDLTQSRDATAPKVNIVQHPDVRRSLLTQKAYAEGLRSLLLWTASWRDRAARKWYAGDDAKMESGVNDLLLPVVKGYGSERSWVLLGTESLQTLGGSGYLVDHPLEQYVRDGKIDTLYEGTTAIQGQDLFFRKIARDSGRTLQVVLDEVRAALTDVDPRLAAEHVALKSSVEDLEAVVDRLLKQAAAAAGANGRTIYDVGLNASRLLTMLGDLLVAWLLVRSASIALIALDSQPSETDRHFYTGKIAAARHFCRLILPHVSAERRICESTDLTIMDLNPAAF
ncbi:acyl-CoA dehydrogenase C-terminal domain-containing protein [Nocardia sp. R6R-6]|uniref:acyl-CoA dehydrogenase C-terminal domain-containing protein n=1 Tax=Nocardia sp. R6R-6 TaxID=3459303 RepID=UPI00403D7C71